MMYLNLFKNRLKQNKKKCFLCIWDNKYYYLENNVEYKTIDFFNIKNGYTEEEIEIINKMNIGETYPKFDDHIIVRLIDND